MAYAGSLDGQWVYEDLREGGALYLAPLSWMPGPRWLTTQSYAVTTWAVGPDPAAARAVSLAWHLLNGFLFWAVLRSIVTPRVAALAVGCFLLWPVQVESVAAVAYRSELVAASWLLLALLCSSHGWRLAAWICAAAAITGKEAGVIALVLVPLWAYWVGPRWSRAHLIGWIVATLAPVPFVLAWAGHWNFRLIASVDAMTQAIGAIGQLVIIGLWSAVDGSVLSIDHDWRGLGARQGVAVLGFAWTVYMVGTIWVRRALVWIAAALSLRILTPSSELHEHHLYTAWLVVSLAVSHLVMEGVSCTSIKSIRARCTEPMVALALWATTLRKPKPWPMAGVSSPLSI